MKNIMTSWGIGPRFAAFSGMYAIPVLILNQTYFSHWTFILFSPSVNLAAGILLISIGLPLYLVPAVTIDRYFEKRQLCTTGIYAYIRHPIYAAWIVWIVPGMILIQGSIPGISIPIIMYLIFRRLIVQEERFLAEKFGQEYQDYTRRVGAIFPKLRRS